MARRPGRPAGPPSRMARAIARAAAPVACGPSSRLKATSGGRAEDDRRDVDGADVRVQPFVAREVDALDRHFGAVGERLVQGPRLGREREHRAVVVGVGVAVEHARAAGREGVADGVEHSGVAALGHVGDGQQHAQST